MPTDSLELFHWIRLFGVGNYETGEIWCDSSVRPFWFSLFNFKIFNIQIEYLLSWFEYECTKYGMGFLSNWTCAPVFLSSADIAASPNLADRHNKGIFVTGCGCWSIREHAAKYFGRKIITIRCQMIWQFVRRRNGNPLLLVPYKHPHANADRNDDFWARTLVPVAHVINHN